MTKRRKRRRGNDTEGKEEEMTQRSKRRRGHEEMKKEKK